MKSITAAKLEQALLKARNKEVRLRRNAQVSSFIFWGATATLAGIAYRDISTVFTSAWGTWGLLVWTLPAAWYVLSWRWAREAAEEWQRIRKSASDRARTAFCSHEESCSCRGDFLQAMEAKGIDLYL